MRGLHILVLALPVSLAIPKGGTAQDLGEVSLGARPTTCVMIEAAARSNLLPVGFFTRLVWEESGFRSDAIGPVTRSGARALGIAQFMPATAAERGLIEPLNPIEAVPKSAGFLAELRYQFGNLGLAAAAYNAGPQRVREFLAGTRNLPSETRNYVFRITSHSVEEWAGNRAPGAFEAEPAEANCPDLLARLKEAPRVAGTSLQRAVPRWCRHLNRPKTSVCGLARQTGPSPKIARLANSRSSRLGNSSPRAASR